MIIRYLADLPQLIVPLATAFQQDRFAHPEDHSIEASAERLRRCARRDDLPMALVGLEHGDLRGTVTLSRESIASRPTLCPWLAGLYVMPAFRRRGFGEQLIRAVEVEARRLEFQVLYTGTSTAVGLFRRLGWTAVERVQHGGEALVICLRHLPEAPASHQVSRSPATPTRPQ